MPIDIKAGMWEEILKKKKLDRENPALMGNKKILYSSEEAFKKAALADAIAKWQVTWDAVDGACWTRALIPSVETFLRVGPMAFTIDYHTAQLLTGHGAFQAYKKRIGKATEEKGLKCGCTKDDADHVIFSCSSYEEERRELALTIREDFSKRNLIHKVTRSSHSWKIRKGYQPAGGRGSWDSQPPFLTA